MSSSRWIAAAVILIASQAAAGEANPSPPALRPVVEVEEDVYRFEPADNGAGPMWCSGSTCLVRIGDDVYASGLETLPQAKPLNNCRWTLWRRRSDGWKMLESDSKDRTREPSPIAVFQGGPLLLSANPTLVPDARAGRAQPRILEFPLDGASSPFRTILPGWQGEPEFTEHSYRSFAADGPSRELILLQDIGYTHSEWAFRARDGRWTTGKLVWPWGAEYDKPQSIRVCYPNVALQERAVYFCGVSDILEPYAKWRAFKKELTGRDWDYDFRRLFFTWTSDITTGQFQPWVEIASRDKTCGWIMPGDLCVAANGDVHLLWNERAIDERLREKFFPGAEQSVALNHAVVRDGKVAVRRAIREMRGERSGRSGFAGRFQLAPDGRLFVFYHAAAGEADKPEAGNRVVEIRAGGEVGPDVHVPMKHPLTSFFTATVRAGSPPSQVIDLLGTRGGARNTISYARVRLW